MMNGKELNEKATEYLMNHDYDKAMEYYLSAAEEGNWLAMYNIACMYYFGDGPERNVREALAWFLKAAECGDPEAASRAGTLQLSEPEVRDEQKAFACFLKAAEHGSLSGMGNLALCFLEGTGTEQNIEEGLAWMEQASAKGNGIASLKMGEYFESGTYVPSDEKKAAEYYERGMKQRYAPAIEKLAKLYEEGRGVAQDRTRAEELRKLASETPDED
ncbi:MAG: sel1 repeat family protein [Solobacterium sp.]|nr:sel1 repeat family protein [Solobacterium sp.]